MAVDYYSYNHNEHKVEEQREDEEEDDYIDMEVSTFPICNNTISQSPQKPREFEFQMSSTINVERNTTTSPADALFYMGKLLPLHLPPRLQMVEKILQDSTLNKFNADLYSTPLGTNAAVTPTTSTPFESCYVSPVESCQVSRELNPEEYLSVFENGCNNQGKKSWTKKLKTKIKSLFGKSDDIVHSCTVKKPEDGSNVKAKEIYSESKIKGSKEKQCTQIPQVIPGARLETQIDSKESNIFHRRSFSRVFKRRYSTTNTKISSSFSLVSSSSSSSSSSFSSSSSTSNNCNGLIDNPLLKRSSIADSEIEASLIRGAIAHCKQSSQQAYQARKTLSEVIGCHSLPTTRFEPLDDQKTTLCRS